MMAAAAPQRLWSALGGDTAVKVISVGMVVYLIVIGFLTYGYARVSDCLAEYADQSAMSTTARANAAAEDRQADKQERDINESERQRLAANDVALDAVLIAMGHQDRAASQRAFKDLLRVRAETSRQRATNDTLRENLVAQRARTEEDRRRNPVPAPPSQSC